MHERAPMRILYIGQSSQLQTRLRQHNKASIFKDIGSCFVAWMLLSITEMADIERLLVDYYRPPLNRRVGGQPVRLQRPLSDFHQTTLRVERELLLKARYFLGRSDKSINEFLVEQLAAFVHQCEQEQAGKTDAECA